MSYLTKTRQRWKSFFHLLLVLVVAGCAKTVSQETDVREIASKISPRPKAIRLKVALHMDETFHQYTHRERNLRVPVGELLSEKVPSFLDTLFAEVHVVRDAANLDPGSGKYNAILRPLVRFTTYHPFFRQRRTLMEPQGRVKIYTEWSLSDPYGREIWFREIVGQAEGDARNHSRFEAGVEAAIGDLLKKLESALLTSSRIAIYSRDGR